ncbi:MAG TPA: EAL domain-containing protein [Trichocoleus sp.]
MPGVVSSYSLESYGNGYALVMEDFGGVSLKDYLVEYPLALAGFLSIALQLADILEALYQRGIIHKDIKPANILIHPKTRQIKLLDFSIASLLTRETQEIQNPNVLEGTLAYLSPEQTGRMNRGIDYRTDFYSLGVTLYELLTGRLPFQAADPLELVHQHLALPPLPPHQVSNCPEAVAEIVMKLMAKNAEDRYQSAVGLRYDLQICLDQLQQTGQIQRFELGQRDVCDRFLISEKLYGRQTEVTALLQAFERVANAGAEGASELVLVTGYAGVGKTAVVNEVHKPILRQRGYFIQGKFDQLNRSTPFSALVQAFRSLVEQLLGEPAPQLQQWRSRILAALGSSGQVIVEVIPELEHLIGPQPKVPSLTGTAAQNRFYLLFQSFVELFTVSEQPLVIFLDDLQWVDSASLTLLKPLLGKTSGHLLVLGAYRDNEVFLAHPLLQMVEELRQQQRLVSTVQLQPLRLPDLTDWIADTLHCPADLARPLAELVHQRTGGNPFFTLQFLKTLEEDGWITFGHQERHWIYNLTQIRDFSLGENVVEFIAQELRQLPADTQTVLQLAACIGNQFDLQTLATTAEMSQIEVATRLWSALQEGWVLPVNEAYKLFQNDPVDTSLLGQILLVPYRFLHDRVQQAAYSLIPDQQKETIHLRIGQLLQRNARSDDGNSLFEITYQLNRGRALMSTPSQRLELAELNLRAGRKALAATAYGTAAEYCAIGLELLPSDSWQQSYSLTLDLHIAAAEAEYLAIHFDRSTALTEAALTHAATLLDQVSIFELQMQIAIAQLQMGSAIDIGLEVLGRLGISLVPQTVPELLQLDLPALVILEQRPVMTDPQQLAAMRILKLLCTPVFQARPEVFPNIIYTMTRLCLEHGNSALSAFAYGFYGLLLVGYGELDKGYQAGQAALKLLDQFEAKKLKATVYNLFNANNRSWKEPARNSVGPLQEGVQSGLETGELEWSGYCAANLCSYLFFTGDHLANIAEQQRVYIDLCQHIQQDIPTRFSQVWHQTALNFQGLAPNPTVLVGSSFDEVSLVPQLKNGGAGTVLYVFHVAKAILAYHFHAFEQVLEQVTLSQPYEAAALGFMQVGILNVYHSLALLARYHQLSAEQRQDCWQQVERNQVQLSLWAQHAPSNYQHRYELVAAEQARVLAQPWQAADLYDQAIATAVRHGYRQEAALANEVAAQFYLEQGREKVAQVYIQEAYQGYAQWGARAKADDLKQRYSQCINPLLTGQQWTDTALVGREISSGSSSAAGFLDLAAVLKASQAISGELLPEPLMLTLMRVVLENAGAERALLILPRHDQLVLVAQCLNSQECETQPHPIEGDRNLPTTLINYVFRTAQTVVADNIGQETRFAADPYVQRHQPKSVLCLPLVKQQHPVGVLYLENNLVSGAFVRDRVEVLKALCAQAVISFENAELYTNLQAASQHLQLSVETLRETQTKLLEATEKLQHDAFHDALTQLPNRQWFIELLDHAIQLNQRHENRFFAVLFIDLDRFKLINDSLGHVIGDELLRQVAVRLQACVRPSDTVARFGGDEFAVLLEELKTPAEAIAIANRIHDQFSHPFTIDRHEVFTGASIGIALSNQQYRRSVSVLQDADIAMYHAKSQGRNRYAVFDPAMQTLVTTRLQLEGDLRRALEAEEFELYYQPIVSLTTGALHGFEALLRWHHPQRGQVSPKEFIPVAEEAGLISPLGWWVINQACNQLHRWQTQPQLASVVVNVNLSAIQLKQADLIEQLQRILETTQISQDQLKLEITESCILETFTLEAQRLKQLKNLGIRLCIDDFGTGYSSLSRLHEFSIDTLKIDRSFVERLSSGSNETVQMIVSLAHSMGVDVVAEGIETQTELEALQALGCEFGQGYLFARPMPAEEVERWLQRYQPGPAAPMDPPPD